MRKMEEIHRLTEENNNLIEINQKLKLDGLKVQVQMASILKNNEILCDDLRSSNVSKYIGKSNESRKRK